MERKTEDLLNCLNKTEKSYDDYLSENGDCFIEGTPGEFWENLIKKQDLKKVDIINRANMGYTYFFDIIKEKKTPSRDVIIKMIIAMKGSLDECQEILRLYGWASLYPKIKRDSIIIFAINHGFGVMQTDELLSKNGEALLTHEQK